MFNTKNATYKLILIIALVLIVAALVLTALAIAHDDSNLASQVSCLFKIAALIYAAYYIFAGFSKDAAKYFKTFAAIFALAEIASLANLGMSANSYFATLVATLSLSAILVLLFSKDLGKKKSLMISAALIVFTVISLIMALANAVAIIVWGPLAATVVLACLFFIMTFAKYVDKASRGRA